MFTLSGLIYLLIFPSFPYEIKRYSGLSAKGAYDPSMVYSQKDIAEIVEHARLRGIRTIAEFDTPRHTRSWGLSYPELLTPCQSARNDPPFDPSNDKTYTFMNNLLREVGTVFPDEYIHLGGDEGKVLLFRCIFH